jgi:tripartite-type tricarboxylate transporter receptor subunit TctC
MKLSRKSFLRLIGGGVAIVDWSALIRSAHALDYPTRPAHIIVGFPAGTSSDITARLIAQRLSEQLGQQFVVENRTGAGTNVAADSVVHASADGYTLLWVTQTNAINATLYDALNFNFIRDIAPVAGILRVPAVMMVNPRCRPTPFPNSLPMPRPIRERSTCRRRESAASITSPASSLT